MISAQRVTELFSHALFQSHEITPDGTQPLDPSMLAVGVGVRHDAGFHKTRLESAREEVRSFLNELPLIFRADPGLAGAGGGWSFLQVCVQADGEIWTGMHQVCEQLLMLGGALGYVSRMDFLPREALPGGVPYFSINLNAGTPHSPVQGKDTPTGEHAGGSA